MIGVKKHSMELVEISRLAVVGVRRNSAALLGKAFMFVDRWGLLAQVLGQSFILRVDPPMEATPGL